MKHQIARPLAVLAAVSLSSVLLYAQSGEIAVWKGELHSDSSGLFEGHTVQLIDSRNHNTASADVRSDGTFEFQHLIGGDYQVAVSNRHGDVLYQGFVTVIGNGGAVEIRLPEEKVERPPSGRVSVSQLLHPPSRKAVACVVAAQKLSQSGQYAKAAAELEKAVGLAPEFAEAHINLSAQYVRLGRYQESLEESDRALQIAPPSALVLSNRAYSQLMLARVAEAIETARKSLTLDPDSAAAHYVLGVALAASGQRLPEAISHLEKAAEVFPTARKNLERLQALLAAR